MSNPKGDEIMSNTDEDFNDDMKQGHYIRLNNLVLDNIQDAQCLAIYVYIMSMQSQGDEIDIYHIAQHFGLSEKVVRRKLALLEQMFNPGE